VSVDLVRAKKRLEALLNRLRILLHKAQTDPFITREMLLECVDRIESTITDMVMLMSMGQRVLITVFGTLMQQEQLLREMLNELRDAILRNNLPQARRYLELLRIRIYSYIRVASVATAGKAVERVEPMYTGIPIPEDLSKNAVRIFALLLQQPGGEADEITIRHLLNLTPEEFETAIEEMKELGYIEQFLRGRLKVFRLREDALRMLRERMGM